MSINSTATADRLHIAFYGKRNAGKSSLVNAVIGQNLSVVSDTLGTTTDPVTKSMELLPLGPVVIIDTPGFDDVGELGQKRVKKTKSILAKTDIAVLVTEADSTLGKDETEFIKLCDDRGLPMVVAHNKSDITGEFHTATDRDIWVSAKTGVNVNELKELLGRKAKSVKSDKRIVGDLIKPGEVVVLVTPIDESAPKGRLILPQQQTLRDVLDSHATAIVCQDTELGSVISGLKNPPKMVITDSQVFGKVDKIVPRDIWLTSFSILFARYKGNLPMQVKGAAMLSKLEDGDEVLIAEGCTHHRQCNDIGTVKMPGWIEQFSGAKPKYTFTSGGEFPEDLGRFKLVVHCGGCMLNEIEMKNRMLAVKNADTAVVNYGVAIANMHGILKRSLEPFPDVAEILE